MANDASQRTQDAAGTERIELGVPEDHGATSLKLAPPEHAVEGASRLPTVLRSVHRLNADDRARLAHCSSRLGVGLGTVLHGAWSLLLQHYTGNDHVALCTRTARVQHSEAASDSDTDPPATAPVLLVAVRADQTTSVWFRALDAQLQQTRLHPGQASPDALVESTLVVEDHSAASGSDSPGIGVRDDAPPPHTPLTLRVRQRDALELALDTNVSRMAARQSGQMLDHLVGLLDRLCDHTDDLERLPLSALQDAWLVGTLLQHRHHYVGCSEEASLVPAVATGGPEAFSSIAEWIDDTCNRYPDRVAIVSEGKHISYRDLQRRANRFCRLVQHNSAPDQRFVGLHCERSPDLIAALIGILKAGYAYLPLDPSYPDKRLTDIVADSGVAWVLSSADHPLPGVRTVAMSAADRFEDTTPELRVATPRAAYLIYTSGSTGNAKGVVISHANLIHSTHARVGHYGNLGDSRFLLLSSFAFDSSVAGIYGTLCSGGALVLPLPEQEKDTDAIARLIQHHGVTHTLCLPSLYGALLETADPTRLQSLQAVIVAGEACRIDTVARHRAAVPHARLYNEYGPTEATVWASVQDITDTQAGPLPIGKPIAGTLLFAMDPAGRPCLPGIEGELAIAGPGLSAGYLNHGEQTGQRFKALHPVARALVADLDGITTAYHSGDVGYLGEDGAFRFSGRSDRQLKVRGYRIEPAEIESCLEQEDGVGTVVVQLAEPVAARPAQHAALVDTLLPALAALAPTQQARLLEQAASATVAQAHSESP
ncbi:MAG: amino acid adenylation domain-containing protein [Pseudomonadota bacterium]